jgi:hypothetical protein
MRIAVVIGSTRPARICPGIAVWFKDAAQAQSPLRYELIDLAEIDLPLLDEPLKAALGEYEHEHTRAWSRIVSAYDGFVFVFPQYNWGYPAPLSLCPASRSTTRIRRLLPVRAYGGLPGSTSDTASTVHLRGYARTDAMTGSPLPARNVKTTSADLPPAGQLGAGWMGS